MIKGRSLWWTKASLTKKRRMEEKGLVIIHAGEKKRIVGLLGTQKRSGKEYGNSNILGFKKRTFSGGSPIV